jgi:hypothetical protein
MRKAKQKVVEAIAVTCDEHGKKPWGGEIVCIKCERVFTTRDASLPTHAPEVCPCGVRLMPERIASPEGSYSARVCCSECFAEKSKPQGSGWPEEPGEPS